MNVLKAALFATSMTLISASALAQPYFVGGNYASREQAKTISVAPASTSDAAYQNAIAELSSLKAMSADELYQALRIQKYGVDSKTTHIKDGGYVTVSERMNEDGQIEFLGNVNVTVHYAERDANR